MHNKRGAADFTTQTQTGRNGPLIVAHFREHEQRDAAHGVARCCNEARPLKAAREQTPEGHPQTRRLLGCGGNTHPSAVQLRASSPAAISRR